MALDARRIRLEEIGTSWYDCRDVAIPRSGVFPAGLVSPGIGFFGAECLLGVKLVVRAAKASEVVGVVSSAFSFCDDVIDFYSILRKTLLIISSPLAFCFVSLQDVLAHGFWDLIALRFFRRRVLLSERVDLV